MLLSSVSLTGGVELGAVAGHDQCWSSIQFNNSFHTAPVSKPGGTVSFFLHGSYAYFSIHDLYLIRFYSGDKVMCCVACFSVLLVESAGLALLSVKQTCCKYILFI